MKVSIVIPVADIPNVDYFLNRCLKSIESQTWKNYEVITPKEGKVAYNMNQGIKRATGDIIKIMCMDDYFKGIKSLTEIVMNWKRPWLVSACLHDVKGKIGYLHLPGWNDQIHRGFNTIGGLSVLAFENKDPLFFTEGLDWVVDIDYFKRLFNRYGLPTFLMSNNVIIGIGEHQTTNNLTDEQKDREQKLMYKTYED